MFSLADNKKIGQYLKNRIHECIKEQRFKSQRQFCKAYLEAADEQVDNVQIQKMSNRLSQILNGKKEIQLYDLPVFCRLLEVSCEDILSAGTSHAPASAHLTNYSASFSKDRQEWEAYVSREDSPFLNADEYGKTVIDYALEAENYDLLKYLMDKQYIWFVGTDEKDFFAGFGAGTSIEKATFPHPSNLNVLDAQLKTRDELRTQMIALAIQHKDIEMLEQLHAREIPTLYQIFLSTNRCEQYYNAKLMEALTLADNKILEYFSKEFDLTDRFGYTNRFLFPFIGELIERLLQNKNSFAEFMLKDAIRHNQYIYDRLAYLLAESVQHFKELPYYNITDVKIKDDWTECILKDLQFYHDGNFVSYFPLFLVAKKRLWSNIIRVNTQSEDTLINRRILELNKLYDAIHHITPKFEGCSEQC